MNSSQLYIPKKLKVGFVKRDDTYTKKLNSLISPQMKRKLEIESLEKDLKNG